MVRQIPQDSQANSPTQSRMPPQIPSENHLVASKKGRRRCRSPTPQPTEEELLRKWNVSPITTREQFLHKWPESPREIFALAFDRNSVTPSPLQAGPQDVESSATVRSNCWRSHSRATSPAAASNSSSRTWRYSA